VLGGASSPSPGTMVREMVLIVVTIVCVDITLLLCELLTERSPLGVPCSILLVQCGLPGPLGSIITGVLLICALMEATDSSSVSSTGSLSG